MSWQVLILLHAFVGAFQTLQSRAIARIPKARHASLAVNAAAFSALYVVGVLIVLIYRPVDWNIAARFWPALLASGACFALASTYMYRSLVYMESAVVSVVTTSTALFTLIFAGIVFGERLSTVQLVGSVILIPCIWYVLHLANQEKQGFKIKSRAWLRGLSFGLLASLLFAGGLVLEKYCLNHVPVGTYIAFGWGAQVLCAWLLLLVLRRSTLNVLSDTSIATMAIRLGVIRATAGALFLFALLKSNNVTLMTVISNFRIVVVAILAGILLKERDHYHQKLVAAAMAFIALGIIFWN